MGQGARMNGRKVIVTVAPTGGVARKSETPHLPVTPEEIADTVARCCELGASVVAVHARNPDQTATTNPEIYKDINARIRAKCDIIINNSTGGGIDGDLIKQIPGGYWENSFDERIKGTMAGADMCTLDCQTQIVFGKGEHEIIFNTSPSRCETLAQMMRDRNIKPEWEVMCHSHVIQDFYTLIEKGYDKPPYYVNFVLGTHKIFQGALPYTPKILMQMVELLPPKSEFVVSAVGPAQLPATTMSVLLGGHVRVGLEDNLYYSRGKLASNEELVKRAVRIIRELGHEPATPAEAREILGLAPA